MFTNDTHTKFNPNLTPSPFLSNPIFVTLPDNCSCEGCPYKVIIEKLTEHNIYNIFFNFLMKNRPHNENKSNKFKKQKHI